MTTISKEWLKSKNIEDNKELINALYKLPAAFYNCDFKDLNGGTSYKNISGLTNLMYLNIDNVESYEETKAKLLNSSFGSSIVTIYQDTLGHGIDFLIGWENDNVTVQNFSKFYKIVTIIIETELDVVLNKTISKANSFAFVSYDPNLYKNMNYKPLKVKVSKEQLKNF